MDDEEPSAEIAGAQLTLAKLQPPQSGKKRVIRSVIGLVIAIVIGFTLSFKALSSFVVISDDEALAENISLKELDAGKFYIKFNGRKDVGQIYLEVDLSVKRSGPAIAPNDPLVIRDALLDLMVKAAELPLVKTAQEPLGAMRSAMLAMAVVEAPWIANIKFRRGNVITQQ